MSNAWFIAVALAVLAGRVAAFIAAVAMKRGVGPIRLVNIAAAAGILAYLATRGTIAAHPVDWPLVALAGFEVVVVGAAIAGRRRVGTADRLSSALFAVHFLASIAAVIVATTFSINRLM